MSHLLFEWPLFFDAIYFNDVIESYKSSDVNIVNYGQIKKMLPLKLYIVPSKPSGTAHFNVTIVILYNIQNELF